MMLFIELYTLNRAWSGLTDEELLWTDAGSTAIGTQASSPLVVPHGTKCRSAHPSPATGAWIQRRRWAWMRGMPKGTKATIAEAKARKEPHDQLKPAGLSRTPSITRARLTPVMRART